MLAAAFLTLSVAQTLFCLAIVAAGIAITYALGLDEGKRRGHREAREQALEHGSEPEWLSGGHRS